MTVHDVVTEEVVRHTLTGLALDGPSRTGGELTESLVRIVLTVADKVTYLKKS